MPNQKLSVVVTRRLPEAVETRMSELFDVTLRSDDTPMTKAELAAAMQTADVLVPTLSDHIDAGLRRSIHGYQTAAAPSGAGPAKPTHEPGTDAAND